MVLKLEQEKASLKVQLENANLFYKKENLLPNEKQEVFYNVNEFIKNNSDQHINAVTTNIGQVKVAIKYLANKLDS